MTALLNQSQLCRSRRKEARSCPRCEPPHVGSYGVLKVPLLALLSALALSTQGVPAQVSWVFSTIGATQPAATQGGFIFVASNNGWAAASGSGLGGIYSIPPRPVSQPSSPAPSSPTPVTCTYSLGVSTTRLPGGTVGDMVPVSAPAGCGWTAQAGAAWIHTSSSGSGDGWVSYTVDANRSSAVRTGTLTVGGQQLTVTQAPEGFVWHEALGWLFAADDGWYHADGLGWTWFHPGGQWLWSNRLQGWLSITDYRARRAWSTQFGWMQLPADNPARLDTELLGPVHVGTYRGQAIPDGWVVSERFGYLWPQGDAVWFYSADLGWLGATGPGRLWSVDQARFL